ncbi:MAG: hypothetical protein M0Z38_12900 [Deltaproteobacteria bacterium]|nr:hypothetical protein [Deltaproteobacteria bacterium]
MAVAIPAGLAWRKCRRLDRELACLRIRISPAQGRERTIRKCDCCPVGTSRARAFAQPSKRNDAGLFAA